MGDFDGDGTHGHRAARRAAREAPRPLLRLERRARHGPVSDCERGREDFDGDGRDDLAFGIDSTQFGGFGLSGTADCGFAPVLFPYFVHPATDMRAIGLASDPANGLRLPLNESSAVTLERDASDMVSLQRLAG